MIDDGATDWKVTQVWTFCLVDQKLIDLAQLIAMNVEEADKLNIKDMASLESAMPGIAQAVQKFFRVYKVSRCSDSHSSQTFFACCRFQLVMARTSLRTTGKSRAENWLRMLWSESQYLETDSMEIISSKQQHSNLNFKNNFLERFLHEEWREMMKNCSIGSVDGEFGMFSTLSTKQANE